ncbi:GH32 C-terminal domain-containing protein [Oribacterium sp. Sow4_G1_1]|uniref:GH32 C-terminal domain-containing protein n=1 Tax=Oribacterium sp. Sow4_G1_1 TaxID=3438794 RepID=UPI003F9CCAE6
MYASRPAAAKEVLEDPDTPVSEVQFPLKETKELSFITAAPATSTQNPNERVIFQRLEEKTNIHIKWTCFVQDQFSDKKNLALAQFGNLPDGLFNAQMSDYDLLRYAKQGIIIPLENLIDKYMPNLQAVFEAYPEYRTMCTAPDGHIYAFPWIEQLGSGKEAIQAIGDIPYINKKWLDYLGLSVPTTTDELEQVLIAFRDHAQELKDAFDIEGDVIPLSFIIYNGDQDPAILINGFGEGYGDTGDHFAVTDEGQVIYTTVQEGHNGHNSVYFLGDYDTETHTFVKEEARPLDYGMDFYAPPTTELPDGRRIMIAWMKSWDACVVPNSQKWQGMMTLPRELTLRDGRIWQQPVRELENYRANACRYEQVELQGEQKLPGIEGRNLDLSITLADDEYECFRMKLAANDEYETSFCYHKSEGILEIDRTYCGVTKDIVCTRKIKVHDPKGLKKLRFILDRQSIELFINDGQQVATTAICTPLEADEIRFYSDKTLHMTVEKYDIVLPA